LSGLRWKEAGKGSFSLDRGMGDGDRFLAISMLGQGNLFSLPTLSQTGTRIDIITLGLVLHGKSMVKYL